VSHTLVPATLKRPSAAAASPPALRACGSAAALRARQTSPYRTIVTCVRGIPSPCLRLSAPLLFSA